MRATLMPIGLPVLPALALLASCSMNNRPSSGVERVAGSADSLQPAISSATAVRMGGLLLRLTVPQRSYVTVISVATQGAISIMAPSRNTSTATEALDPGPHTLSLVQSAAFMEANAKRLGRVQNTRDGATIATDSPYPIHSYTVVVATTRPLTLDDQQESLADVDLLGPDEVVVQRVAEAVGTHSAGPWAASFTKPSTALSPF